MLKYGEAYLEQNEVAIQRLAEGMSQRAIDLAMEMAPDLNDEEQVEDDELEAA